MTLYNNGTTIIIIKSSLSELDKMWSRLATQFFNFLWVVAREQHLWQALKNEMQSNIYIKRQCRPPIWWR